MDEILVLHGYQFESILNVDLNEPTTLHQKIVMINVDHSDPLQQIFCLKYQVVKMVKRIMQRMEYALNIFSKCFKLMYII